MAKCIQCRKERNRDEMCSDECHYCLGAWDHQKREYDAIIEDKIKKGL